MKIIAKINEGSDIINAEYLKEELGKIRHFLVVDDLPELADADLNTVYLQKKSGSPAEESDIYDEWVCTQKGDDTSTRAWELLGDTRINLDNYYTKEEVDAKIGEAANVNEYTFIFKDDLTTTTGVGRYAKATTGYTTIEAKGKTFKTVWDDIFNEELNPKTTKPSLSLSADKSVSSANTYEVGAKVDFTISTTFNKGSYTYDASTGVTPGTYTINFNGTTYSTSSVNISQYQFTDSIKEITGNVTYSDGIIPHTNIGKEYSKGQIKADTATATSISVKAGYRRMYAGFTNVYESSSVTANAIKTLEKNAKFSKGVFCTLKVSDTSKLGMMIAMQHGKGGIKVLNMSSMGDDITSSFTKYENLVTVPALGDDAGIAYDVWMYKSASMTMDAEFKIEII